MRLWLLTKSIRGESSGFGNIRLTQETVECTRSSRFNTLEALRQTDASLCVWLIYVVNWIHVYSFIHRLVKKCNDVPSGDGVPSRVWLSEWPQTDTGKQTWRELIGVATRGEGRGGRSRHWWLDYFWTRPCKVLVVLHWCMCLLFQVAVYRLLTHKLLSWFLTSV